MTKRGREKGEGRKKRRGKQKRRDERKARERKRGVTACNDIFGSFARVCHEKIDRYSECVKDRMTIASATFM